MIFLYISVFILITSSIYIFFAKDEISKILLFPVLLTTKNDYPRDVNNTLG